MPTDAQRRNLASAHHAEVQALNERIAGLEQQLAEARKDTARLDFMIFYSAEVRHGRDGEYCRVVWQDDEFDEQTTKPFGDSREAIDAAITRTQEQP